MKETEVVVWVEYLQENGFYVTKKVTLSSLVSEEFTHFMVSNNKYFLNSYVKEITKEIKKAMKERDWDVTFKLYENGKAIDTWIFRNLYTYRRNDMVYYTSTDKLKDIVAILRSFVSNITNTDIENMEAIQSTTHD